LFNLFSHYPRLLRVDISLNTSGSENANGEANRSYLGPMGSALSFSHPTPLPSPPKDAQYPNWKRWFLLGLGSILCIAGTVLFRQSFEAMNDIFSLGVCLFFLSIILVIEGVSIILWGDA